MGEQLLDNLRVDTDFEDGRTISENRSVLRVNSGRRVQRDEIREKMIEVALPRIFKGMAVSSRDAPPTRADTETQEWEVNVGGELSQHLASRKPRPASWTRDFVLTSFITIH